MKFLKLLSLLVISIGFLSGIRVPETVSIPCQSYKEGTVLVYSTVTDKGIKNITEAAIISNKNGIITATLKTISSSLLPGEENSSILTITYIQENGMTSLKYTDFGSTTEGIRMDARNSYNPPQPICGTIPIEWTITNKTRVTLSGNVVSDADLYQTEKIKIIGTESITLKIGTFMATVAEISKVQKSGKNMPPTDSKPDVTINYYVEGFGVVKSTTLVNADDGQKHITELELIQVTSR